MRHLLARMILVSVFPAVLAVLAVLYARHVLAAAARPVPAIAFLIVPAILYVQLALAQPALAQQPPVQPVIMIAPHYAEVNEGQTVSFDVIIRNVPPGGVNFLYRLVQYGDPRFRPAKHIESAHYGSVFVPEGNSSTVTVSTTTDADNLKEEDYEIDLRALGLRSAINNDIVDSLCSKPSPDPYNLIPSVDESCYDHTVVKDLGGIPTSTEIPSKTNYASIFVPRLIGPGDPFTVTFSLSRPAPASGITLAYALYERNGDYLVDSVAPHYPYTTRNNIFIPAGQTSATRTYRIRSTDTDNSECKSKYSSLASGTVTGCIVFHLIATSEAGEDGLLIYETYPAIGRLQSEEILVVENFIGLSINDVKVHERDGMAEFTLSLTRPASATVSVDLETRDGTAGQPGDYTRTTGRVSIVPPARSAKFQVPVINDTIVEPDETLAVLLRNVSGATITDDTGIGTIIDDDETVPPGGPPQISVDDVIVAEHAGPAVFTVSLSHPVTSEVRVNIATRNGSALAPGDYIARQETLVFPPGTVTRQVPVAIVDDTVAELNENFQVLLATPVNGIISDDTGVGIITDDDTSAVQISINDIIVAENAGPGVFTLSLSRASTSEIRVNTITSDGSARHPGDYTETRETVIFPAGITSMRLEVPITNDSVAEPDETFNVTLDRAVNAVIADDTGIGTITDDDAAVPIPGLSINDVTVAEDAGNAVFTVSLSRVGSRDISVNVSTSDGTAVQPADYIRTRTTVVIPAGTRTRTVAVPVVNDSIHEITETFNAILDTPAHAVIIDGTGIGTITDDDEAGPAPIPELSINDIRLTENAGQAVFTVTLSEISATPVTVNARTMDGSALAPADYANTTGLVTFAPGTTTQSFRVPVVNDDIAEPDETFTVRLYTASGASIADETGIATILDDGDSAPRISVNDVTVAENAGPAVFTVSLSKASGYTVLVNATTANGTALHPGDYTLTSRTVTFAPGVTTGRLVVAVINDLIAEPNENFTVQLASAVNATIADETGLGTITDDDRDRLPQVSINDVRVAEHAGQAVFTVSLSRAVSDPVSITAATRDGTALQPGDYTRTSARVTFAPGSVSQRFSVPIIDDSVLEPDETFTVLLSTPVNGQIADDTGLGTITDNDAPGPGPNELPRLQVNDVTVAEHAGPAVFALSLSQASANRVSVNVSTVDGTALQPGDYIRTRTTVSFAPGELRREFSVPIVDDDLAEVTETFTVRLDTAAHATIADDTGIGTITDHDPAGPAPLPALSVNDLVVAENAGPAVFTLSLSRTSTSTITVNVATRDGSALQPDDYTSASGQVTFAPGTRTAAFRVPVINDDLPEPDETFNLRLASASGATIADDTGIATITDDGDALPGLSINDVTLAEDEGPAVFTVSLSKASGYVITVTAATRDGTALHPGDYIRTSQTVTFSPGTLVQQFPVSITDDDIVEFNESFTVQLATVINAVIVDETGLGTITDEDTGGPGPGPNPEPRPAISVNDVTLAENKGPAMFTVSLSRTSTATITVNATTRDGSARHPDDYTRTSSALTFAPGTVSAVFPVPVIDDEIPEPNETFTVRLASASNASIADDTGIATITDDGDRAPGISVNDVILAEDEGPAVFTISLSKPSGHEISLTATTRDGSAVQPDDYTRTSARVIFAPGTTLWQLPIPVVDDEIAEPDEDFTLNLGTAINAAFADPVGLGRIIDDDDPGDGPGPANAPPVADAGPDQRVYFNETVRLDGSRSYDPDGDIITHAWMPVSPSGPALTAANSVHPGFIAGNTIAIHHFQLTVRDPSGLSSTDTVSIHVVQDPLPLGPPIGEFILDRHRATLNDQPKLIRFLRGVQRGPSDAQQQQQQPSTPQIIYDAYTYSAGKYGKRIKPEGEFTAVVTPERVTAATEFYRNGFWGEFTGIRSKTRRGSSMHLVGSVGYHRIQSQRFLYGIMAQFQSSDTETTGYTGEISGKGWLAGPYFAARHKSQPLYFEGRFLLGKSSNTVEINEPGKGSRTGHFTTSRWLAQLRMEGNINLGNRGTRLIPYADIRQIQGETDPFMAVTERGTHIGVSRQTVKTGQLEFGSIVEIPIDVRHGNMLFTAGAGIILSRTKGQYVQDLSSHRGRIEAGLQYRLDENVFYEFDAFIDGIAESGYRGYGLSVTGEYKF